MSITPDVKHWLGRLAMMSRVPVVELHPTEAARMYRVFKALSDSKESFETVYLKVCEEVAVLEQKLAVVTPKPKKKPKKKA